MASLFHCRGCTNRYPGCHSKCEIYIADKAEYDRIKAAKDVERGIDEYVLNNVNRAINDRSMNKRRHSGIVKPTGK